MKWRRVKSFNHCEGKNNKFKAQHSNENVNENYYQIEKIRCHEHFLYNVFGLFILNWEVCQNIKKKIDKISTVDVLFKIPYKTSANNPKKQQKQKIYTKSKYQQQKKRTTAIAV